MMHPTEEGQACVAKKAIFHSLRDILRAEFYWALTLSNAPRHCHNCGTYFLLTAGYSTCYCNNVAPGKTERTCWKMEAHRKEPQGKDNRTPAHQEYDWAYNRPKARKQQGKISLGEWNAAVIKAQALLGQSERGELTGEEIPRLLKEL